MMTQRIAVVTGGKLRMLASASPMRWTELPNVPTMKEQGFNVEIDSWMGLAVPTGTPRPILDRQTIRRSFADRLCGDG